MNQQKSDKLKALIEKGKWSYIFKFGVLGWGVSTAILLSALMHFIERIPFTESIFVTLVLFAIGGVFWGLFMWFFINREFNKLQQG
jgi:hypothetical protein